MHQRTATLDPSIEELINVSCRGATRQVSGHGFSRAVRAQKIGALAPENFRADSDSSLRSELRKVATLGFAGNRNFRSKGRTNATRHDRAGSYGRQHGAAADARGISMRGLRPEPAECK